MIIPSAGDIQKQWDQNIQQQIGLLLKPFSEKLEKYLEDLQKKTEELQKNVFQDIQDKINKEHCRHNENHEHVKERWEPLQCHAKMLDGALYKMKKAVGMQ